MISVVFNVFNGINIFEMMKFILLKIVFVLNFIFFKILKDKVVGILMINIKILLIIVIFLCFVLLFFVKLEIFNFNKEIDDVKVVNKNSIKNFK